MRCLWHEGFEGGCQNWTWFKSTVAMVMIINEVCLENVRKWLISWTEPPLQNRETQKVYIADLYLTPGVLICCSQLPCRHCPSQQAKRKGREHERTPLASIAVLRLAPSNTRSLHPKSCRCPSARQCSLLQRHPNPPFRAKLNSAVVAGHEIAPLRPLLASHRPSFPT